MELKRFRIDKYLDWYLFDKKKQEVGPVTDKLFIVMKVEKTKSHKLDLENSEEAKIFAFPWWIF